MKVDDPSGQTWRVSRRWVPWPRRTPDDDGHGKFDADNGSGSDTENAFLGLALTLLIFSLLFIAPILVLAVFVAGQLLLLLLVIPVAVLLRVLFDRRWRVEVRRDWVPWAEVDGGSWKSSGAKIHQLADAVRRGDIPQRTLGAEPPA